ncbi:RHS repeat-associated core domain-containing protein [Ruficoccus sp. ZRK36]|uniref:RHS repeat-associated core domain-containing protein n=1 Tax=Ruficoccus sp. ZRK36 TaxID=2866311 RepID=UPI001C735293|nr:RHS repeat-associated core domain-containing protein [Ruficoccus sp. ZRK36]QYY34564.1 hypothetical protein K0V07_09640 [Ruficoccus sp. ZRK36]
MNFKLFVTAGLLLCGQAISHASETPAWAITDKEGRLKDFVERHFINPPSPEEVQAMAALASPQMQLASVTPASNGIGFAPEAITPEIQELAKGLQYDALKIYDYCLNRIEYEHYWGSYKGATLTLLEGSGNCFDTSSLMIALLRESGYTANYRYGVRRVYDGDLEAWQGLALYGGPDLPFDQYTNAQLVAEYGIPAGWDPNNPTDVYDWRFILNRINFSIFRGYPAFESAFGYGLYWDMPHVWVEVTVDGTPYELDPCFKPQEAVGTAIDLKAATQYNRAALLTAAGGTASGSTITGLSETNIGQELTGYTSNLLQWLKTNHPGKSFEEIMGRSRNIPLTVPSLDYYSLTQGVDYLTSLPWLTTTTWTTIPAQWTPKLIVTIGQYNYSTGQFTSVGYTNSDIRLNSLQGQKLSLWFDGNQANFCLDEASLASVSVSGATVDIALSVNQPHGEFDAVGNFIDTGLNDTGTPVVTRYAKDDTNAYAFPYSFRAGPRLIRKRQDILQGYIQGGADATDWRVRTELLNITGASFMEQTRMSDEFVNSQFGVIPMAFHRFGRVAQEESYYVDMFLQAAGPESFKTNEADRLTSNHVTALFDSALEHGILEQSQTPGDEAVSTIKVLHLANEQNIPIYRIDSSNWNGSLQSTLQSAGYPASVTSEINTAVTSADGIVLIPADASITLNQWTGYAYAIMKADGNVMKINSLNGGYNTIDMDFDYDLYYDNFYYESGYLDTGSSDIFYVSDPVTTPQNSSREPVDMASGAYMLDKVDLQLGQSAPRGLVFSRSYNSNRRYDMSAGLGYGWTHNLDAYITERSAPRASLGSTTHYQAAPYLAAVVAVVDLYTDHTTPKEWLTASLAAKWAVDQLSYNSASVTMGGQSIEFVRMPDGEYLPPAGITLSLTKDGENPFVLTERNGNTYTFNADNRLSTISDQYGKTLSFTYADDRLTTVTDAYNRTLSLTWSGDKITRVSDSTGREVNYAYTDDDLVTVTDADAHDWVYVYDTEHRMTELRDPLSRVIAQNEYDARSRVSIQKNKGDPSMAWNFYYSGYVNWEVDPQGGYIAYHYDDRGRAVSVENALGQADWRTYDGQDHIVERTSPLEETTTYLYDADNNLTETTDPLTNVASNIYDGEFRLQSATDFRGNTMSYTYNDKDQVLTVTDAKNIVVQTNTYDANGNLETVTDADDNTTTYSYDAYGNINRIDYPNDDFETFIYNARGDLLSHTNSRNFTTTFTYNNRRQMLVTTYSDTTTSVNTYDGCGNLASEQDSNGNVTSYTYSASGKLLTTTLPTTDAGAAIITNTYDSRDWLETTTDSLDRTTTFTYDAAGRVIAATNPLDETAQTQFDANGRVSASINPLEYDTGYGYDARGNRTTLTDANDKVITYGYDENGNQTSILNRRNATFSFTYDPNNRLLTTATPTNRTTTQIWNDRGLLASIEEPSGQTTTFSYDERGRVDTKTDPVATTSYTLDSEGNVETVTENGASITRVFDDLNRITSYTDSEDNTIGYGYDDNGNLTSLTYPGNKTVTYTYNERNQLKTVTDWQNRLTTYTYDLTGRLAQVDLPNGTSRHIVYDDADRVTRMEERKANDHLFALTILQYDDAGQVTGEFKAPISETLNLPTASATYDQDNRISVFNGLTLAYDLDGNMTSGPLMDDTLVSYSFDARNRLTEVDGHVYTYDAEGNRIASTYQGETTTYVVDANAALSRTLMRTTPEGTTYYVYGSGLLYEVSEAEEIKTYHFDNRGSTVAIVADDGLEITDRVEYSPYGITTKREGTTDTPFLYNGKFGVMTDDTGLLFMRSRYYNPHLRRFINPDPIGFSGGMNWYAYADGNPISNTDPFGLWSWNQTFGVLKAIGGAVEVAAGVALGAATSWTGVGAIAGGAVAVHGLDTFQAGIRQAISGEQTDTLTSTSLQAAGLSRNSANLLDTGISVVGTFGAGSMASSLSRTQGLVHLTDDATALTINQTQRLVSSSGNYAGPVANASASGIGVTLRTGLNPGNYSAVQIPATAADSFTAVRAVGPFTTWQSITGQAYTAAGSLNLATGNLARTGLNYGQSVFYGLDAMFTGSRFIESFK